MTSVQNHQQQLSGNKILRRAYFISSLALVLGVTSCLPKTGVLRSPDYKGTMGTITAEEAAKAAELARREAADREKERENIEKVKALKNKSISLLLPFQLHQVNTQALQSQDVQRSAMSLDFYQGFQLGLEELAAKGNKSFNLNVLDSRDNPAHVSDLSVSKSVLESSLIVGPVYPQEIKAFGARFEDKEVLQINPLAASMPTEFNLPNLVSITPPIKAHANAIAMQGAKEYLTGDIIIVYNTPDADSRQFLNGMMSAIKEQKASANIVTVSTLAQLNEQLSTTGTNLIVTGTTDKTHLNNLVGALSKKYTESYNAIKLFGHPLWDRYDFSNFKTFAELNPIISTESNLKSWTTTVKTFNTAYFSKFGVNPSDQSYKGYDAAIFFGNLLHKYGPEKMKEGLLVEKFTGIYNTYQFRYNESWGYANEHVSFKEYRNGGFQLK